MNLYEAVRWGNDSPDPIDGGPDGPDTCFLVRASSIEEVAAIVAPLLAKMPHERVQPYLHAIYLIGTDAGAETPAIVLRGPYVQHAHNWGWREWERTWNGESFDDPWRERTS